MSYSFSITAKTKDEAYAKVEAELAKVVASQPSHAADKQAAQDVAKAFIDMLKEPNEGEGIRVDMSGSLSWHDADTFTAASVSINAYISTAVGL